MIALIIIIINLGCVSAQDIDDTNSTILSIDDYSQTIENINDEFISSPEDSTQDVLSDGDISLDIQNQKSSYSKSDNVTVKMSTYSMASSSDVVTVYLNSENIGTTSYSSITTSGYVVPLNIAHIGSNSIYCSFTASSIWQLTSDTVTFTVTGDDSNDTDPIEDGTATITIWDRNYPSQSTITSNGDYTADIEYTITKNGDSFTDESLDVIVNGESIGSTTPNSYNRLGNINITEDSQWILTIIYTATVNGKTINATSNTLTFITRNTSGGNSSNNESSDNKTEDDNSTSQGDEIKLIIRDSSYPNVDVINFNDKNYATIQYYINLPSGDLVTSDIVFYCNGEAITTIDEPIDKSYTSIGASIYLNETGDYVFTAQYSYWVWGGENNKINSNSLTYHVNILNETQLNGEPALSISINDVTFPSQVTANVKSNIDGDYVITIENNSYEVRVTNGSGSVSFTLPANNYTAQIQSKTNTSFKNSTTFNIYPKAKTRPAISVDVKINGEKINIQVNLPVTIDDEKISIRLNNNINKEESISKGVANFEFDNLDDGDYSYTITYNGNEDYDSNSYTNSFVINTQNSNNASGNETTSGNQSEVDNSSSHTNQSETDSSGFTIVADNLKRTYNSPYDFKATFYDKKGNLLTNSEVNFIVNGNDNIVITDEFGVGKLVKKLSVGKYAVEIRNLVTGDVLTKNCTIIKRISGNLNINVDYSYIGTYKVRIYADNGNVAGSGENVLIILNNVRYNVKTDKNGYATLKISNLLPKTYTITATYKGITVSNKVVVKQILKSKNVNVKKSKKTKKFTATLKTSKGKAITGKKITFKIKGKTYTSKTDKKGVATINIKQNLKVGSYKVTITYLRTSISKTLKIKR